MAQKSLKHLLKSVQFEISLLRSRTAGLEAACLGENTETTSRVALQDFDLINQSLEALENLVGAISDEVPETQGINKHDVLQKIHLGAMIERLKSTNPIRPEEPIKPNGNECELF